MKDVTLTPTTAAERFIAILRRRLPINDRRIVETEDRIYAGATWSTVSRFRQIRSIALEIGLADDASSALFLDLHQLREDISARLSEIGGGR